MQKKHNHYHKPCGHATVDVYRVLQMFEVTDQAIGHAVKKLLVAGKRGAGKSYEQDIQEAIDTLSRALEMRREDLTLRQGSFVAGLVNSKCTELEPIKVQTMFSGLTDDEQPRKIQRKRRK